MDETEIGGPREGFATTLWTEVLRGREGLETLIAAYWKPLYAFARRKGAAVEEAKDLVQEFFARLLEKDWLAAADPGRGRFRTFLLTAFVRFLSTERERGRALKRGGGARTLSLDLERGEEGLRIDPADRAEEQFDRDWALTVLRRALERLKREGDPVRVGLLEATLGGENPSTAELAARFGVQEHDVKNHLHRARARLRELMLDEVSAQVDGDPDPELRFLADSLKPRRGNP